MWRATLSCLSLDRYPSFLLQGVDNKADTSSVVVQPTQCGQCAAPGCLRSPEKKEFFRVAYALVVEYVVPAPADYQYTCASACVLCRTYCYSDCGFASVVLIVFTCTCGGVNYVSTSSVRCTCTCRGVHRASTSGVRNTCGGALCASTIMNVAPAFFVVYIAPAPAV